MYSSGPTSRFFAFEIWEWMPARREPLRVEAEILEAGLDDAYLIRLVVDRERRAVAEPRRLATENPAARGMEGEDPDRTGSASEHLLEPLPHLTCGLVRERDREDLVGLDTARSDQMRDAVREHARLPRAGARDHEQRPFDVEHGLALRLVQDGEVIVGLHGRVSRRHHVDATRRSGLTPVVRIGLTRVVAESTISRDCGPGGSAAPRVHMCSSAPPRRAWRNAVRRRAAPGVRRHGRTESR